MMYNHDSYDSHTLTFHEVDIEEVDTFYDKRSEEVVEDALDNNQGAEDILGP